MGQSLRDRLLSQANRILSDFKPKKKSERELTNQDITMLLTSHALYADNGNKLSEDKEEWVHSILCHLNAQEMEVVGLRFYQAKTEQEIADHFNKSQTWAHETIQKILTKLRGVAGDKMP